jgi:hypothetical protein
MGIYDLDIGYDWRDLDVKQLVAVERERRGNLEIESIANCPN